MNYDEAARTRRTGLLSLIAEKKFQDGKSIGSSIGGAISDKFKAKAVGIKEKFDPLNMIRAVAGRGVIGKSLVTIAGRAMGKDEGDIRHFGGYGSRKRKLHETLDRKDPLISTIGPGAVVNIRPGDTAANILAKTYNFMEKTHEKYKQNYELEQAFRKEQYDEDERRHEKLINALLNRKEPSKEEEGSPKSFIEKLLDGLKTALGIIMAPLKGLLSLMSGLTGILLPLISGVAGSILSVIAKSAGLIVEILTIPLLSLMKKLLARTFGVLLEGVVGTAVEALSGPLGAVMAILGAGATAQAIIQESQSTRMGPEAAALDTKHAEELRDFEVKHPSAYRTTEQKAEFIALQAKQRDEKKVLVEKFEKETLIPAMEKIGYKPQERNQAGELIFKNDKGETADIRDYKRALNGEDWFDKLLMRMVTGEEISPKQYQEKKTKELIESGTKQIENDVKDLATDAETKIKSHLPKLSPDASVEVKSIPPLEETDPNGIGKKEQVVSVVNTQNNIGGGAPKMVDTGTTALRNNEIHNAVWVV
jgi:hypothetical protein